MTELDLPDVQRIVLIGFMASGKSAVAAALADRLGWRAIDTDDLIESDSGRNIPDLFADEGEPAFRARERAAVAQAAAESQVVVATGGGVWLDAGNREALCLDGFIVGLEARLDTILARHAATEMGRPDARPLLAGGEPIERIQQLKAQRQPFYALVDATVHTDETPVDAVVDEILDALRRDGARVMASQARRHAFREGPGVEMPASVDYGPGVSATVATAGGSYPIYCDWGLLDRMPEILERVGVGGRAFIVTDEAVDDLYAQPIALALEEAGRDVVVMPVAGGESNKNLAALEALYADFATERAERGDAVIAVGGGVVTDLAGTVAATYLRGMALVHVPTTLLGMVDAAIGGKVAVDLPQGKNLVGAFYQPRAVVADIATLATLPPRDLRAGYGEVIKHAFIRDVAMLDELERDAELLLNLNGPDADRERAVSLIGRNMAIKAAVVSADERESDLRMILKYGHTIGHALEAVTGYGALLHGEAVALGLMGAARIGRATGLLDDALVERHHAILQRFGLPTSVDPAHGVELEAVLEAMQSDKKVAAGAVRWILLEGVGSPVLRDDIPPEAGRAAVESLLAG